MSVHRKYGGRSAHYHGCASKESFFHNQHCHFRNGACGAKQDVELSLQSSPHVRLRCVLRRIQSHVSVTVSKNPSDFELDTFQVFPDITRTLVVSR